jgi:RNA polymerase sigma factor (sigma-70 family)
MPDNASAGEFQNSEPRDFRTTHWSMVLRAGDSQSPDSARALERLCRTYWYPLYAFVRRKGHSHEEAQDLTQGFFEKLLAKDYLADADRQRGKFRTFLLTSFSHFLANEWDRSRTLKRGGNVVLVSLEAEAEAEERYKLEPVDNASADKIFEQRWAHTLMATVLERLAAETEAKRFEALKNFLMGDDTESYAGAAAQLGISVAAVTSAIHRLRARFGVLLRDEIGNTVASPEEVEDEIVHLMNVLAQ